MSDLNDARYRIALVRRVTMGMYDTITFRCPHCGALLEIQTKAGECTLENFDSDAVPIELANDVLDEMVYCDSDECGQHWTIVQLPIPHTVRLGLAR